MGPHPINKSKPENWPAIPSKINDKEQSKYNMVLEVNSEIAGKEQNTG